MRILIVEDEFNLADVISSRLKKEKYKDISINDQQQDDENISEKKQKKTYKIQRTMKIHRYLWTQ